jgi:hypothetical protein
MIQLLVVIRLSDAQLVPKPDRTMLMEHGRYDIVHGIRSTAGMRYRDSTLLTDLPWQHGVSMDSHEA